MFKIIETAKSKNGNEIQLIENEVENFDKTILIIGMFHGDEPQGEFLIRKFLQTEIPASKNKLLFIPCLNPDGKALNTRQNANGVDLNRNFPTKNYVINDDKHYYGGNIPSSEIETKFIINILEKYMPDFVLTLHSPYKIVNYDGPAKTYAEDISKLTGYPVQEDIGYPTYGSFGTYAGKEKQIPVITLELPEDEEDEVLWEENKAIFDYCANKI